VFAYGESAHLTLETERGVTVTGIVYKKDGVTVGGVTFDIHGEPIGASTYPVDAGEYVAEVTLSGFGKVATVNIPYVVEPKRIASEDIVVIGLKQWYEENITYVVSYGTRFNVPLEATYEVAEGQTGTLTNGLPAGVGRYKVTIRVVSMNFVGEAVSYLDVVEVCEVTFMNGTTPESSVTVEKGKAIKSPYRPLGDNFVCWCSDEGLEEPFDFTQVITEDTTLYAKFQ